MTFELMADIGASITELKRNPMRVLHEGAGEAVVIIHRNKPAFYAVPPALYEAMLGVIDNAYLVGALCARHADFSVHPEANRLISKSKPLA